MEKDPIYETNGKITIRKAVPFGLQHVLAMFVANIAPILIVAGAVKMDPAESAALVQSAMIVAGIGSLLQLFPICRKKGHDRYSPYAERSRNNSLATTENLVGPSFRENKIECRRTKHLASFFG